MLTDLFYTLNFSFTITVSLIGLIFSCLLIGNIISHRKCYTVTNLLLCESCINALIFFLTALIGCFYGMHSTRPNEQPFCTLRAYIILATVTSASYSFLIQSISRLFFIWFHTNRILISWRTHWILILIKYTLSYLISIQPFFVEHGFDFIDDVRMCSITTKIPFVSLYTLIMSSVLPTNGVIIIYSILLYRIRCLVRRVSPMINRSPRVIIAKRNLKILQHILILLSILACGSIPFGIVCFWNIISDHDVPEELHFISMNFLVLSATIMATVLFFRNKMVKDILVKFYQLHCQ